MHACAPSLHRAGNIPIKVKGFWFLRHSFVSMLHTSTRIDLITLFLYFSFFTEITAKRNLAAGKYTFTKTNVVKLAWSIAL
jgi:hypothetical protein